jgi:DMSO reductase anchor subunit
LYIIEVMLLVTALIGPIFVALSMFPVGTKPMLAWGTSFLSLGFCKICFSLISGLSAIAFVYAGPDNIDMTVVAVVLGILAPVLAFGIASGSGLNALSNVSQISQNFGINTGAAYYVPGSGQPSGNNDNATMIK